MLTACTGQPGADNPLLAAYGTPYDVPPFDRIEPAHFEPAFEAAMAQERAEVAAVAANPEPPSFENTIAALDRAGGLLTEVMGVFYSACARPTPTMTSRPWPRRLRPSSAPTKTTPT